MSKKLLLGLAVLYTYAPGFLSAAPRCTEDTYKPGVACDETLTKSMCGYDFMCNYPRTCSNNNQGMEHMRFCQDPPKDAPKCTEDTYKPGGACDEAKNEHGPNTCNKDYECNYPHICKFTEQGWVGRGYCDDPEFGKARRKEKQKNDVS